MAKTVDKKRILRVMRNIAISVVVLLVVVVGGGVAYTWYVGQYPGEKVPVAAVPVAPEPVAPPTRTPIKPAPDAPVGASVRMLTSPVAPGDNASITVKTNPDAKCKIKVTYDDVQSKDSGLSLKVADEYGIVSWTWTVEATVPVGEWPVEVTCANAKKSAMVKGYLVVKK